MDTPKQTTPTPPPDMNVLRVEVRNPESILFSGTAVAVSSRNSVGPLDILPQHENFISILTDKIVIRQDKHQKQEIPNQSAIVKAQSNKVSIFLGAEALTNPPPPDAETKPSAPPPPPPK